MGFLALLTDVLFVGHSLIGPDLPPLVEGGLRLMERPASVSAQIINGAPLRFNLQNSANAEGVDARAELAKGQTEVLILTEAIPLAEHLRWNDTPGAIAAFAELAKAGNPEVRVFVYETWHSRNGAVVEGDPNSALPWRERLTADLPLWEGALRESGAEVALVPAGQAMARLSDAVAAGTVPGVASMDDFFSDDIHLSDKGRYFVALVHLAAITGTSPEGLPAQMTRAWRSREAVIADDLAAVLQRLAWEAVSGYSPAAVTAETEPAPVQVQTAADAPEAEVVAPVPAPAPPIAQTVIDPTALTPITNPNLALGLHGITDWSVQQPFLDVMKTAREWTGHLPGQYGGWDHDRLAAAGALGLNGWPVAIPPEITGISTLVLVDLPADAGGVAGRYLVHFAGKGGLRIEGRAQNVVIGDGMAQFDFTPGEGGVVLTLDSIDAVDPIRDIVIVREDRAALLAGGAVFNPDWLSRLRGVKTIRLMDWMRTNDSKLAQLEDRPQPEDYTWTRIGAPIEVMVALANALDANPWFTMPHLASDALVRFYAEAARDGLEPGLVAHVEFSNEVWNWQFDQAAWAEEQGRARWGGDSKWVQYYAQRAGEVATIWADVYGDEAETRLVRILATQTGWLGLEDQILTAPDVIAEGGVAPATLFDAWAITGYFSALLGSDEKAAMVRDWITESEAAARAVAQAQGLQGAEAEAFVTAHRFDLAVARAVPELESGAVTGKPEDSVDDYLTRTLPHQAQAAAAHGLRLMMYEGGSHVVGHGAQVDDDLLTAFFVHLSYTPEMAQLYDRVLQGWAAVTPEPFNAFVDLASPGKWGSWGALRHLGDDNPRWQVLAKGCLGC
ncbi:hypothetical protein [Pseudotabrizicola alkalilacus]|uniref:Uncharacterized protein n=1 Tax=Pseudotabrizicola alkalilacus TaxID=2305252 RepID=A0A411YZF7_9RHOB|nr:hypothetical protein [Pseudotabrizicola alkalilacus]RGP36194.1 hypothetical protein D1012_15485 [Pseudotabrizicola alkalilacus]